MSKHLPRHIGTVFIVLSWLLSILIFGIICTRWTVAWPLKLFPPSFAIQYNIPFFSFSSRLIGLSIEMVPFVCQILILRILRKIGTIFKDGNLILSGIGILIQQLGRSIFFLSLANIFYSTTMNSFLSYLSNNNQFTINFGLSTAELYLFVTSLVIYSLGFLAKDGEDLKQENEEII